MILETGMGHGGGGHGGGGRGGRGGRGWRPYGYNYGYGYPYGWPYVSVVPADAILTAGDDDQSKAPSDDELVAPKDAEAEALLAKLKEKIKADLAKGQSKGDGAMGYINPAGAALLAQRVNKTDDEVFADSAPGDATGTSFRTGPTAETVAVVGYGYGRQTVPTDEDFGGDVYASMVPTPGGTFDVMGVDQTPGGEDNTQDIGAAIGLGDLVAGGGMLSLGSVVMILGAATVGWWVSGHVLGGRS